MEKSIEVTKESLSACLTSLVSRFDQDLYAKTKGQLEDYWHFKWDESASIEHNIYDFTQMLELYRSFVRRWEEHHNGSCCVVERVRDEYLMKKIGEFKSRLSYYYELKFIHADGEGVQ